LKRIVDDACEGGRGDVPAWDEIAKSLKGLADPPTKQDRSPVATEDHKDRDPSDLISLLVLFTHARHLLGRLRDLLGPEEAVWRGMEELARLKQLNEMTRLPEEKRPLLESCSSAVERISLLVAEAEENPARSKPSHH
jgi:hypothetical protein